MCELGQQLKIRQTTRTLAIEGNVNCPDISKKKRRDVFCKLQRHSTFCGFFLFELAELGRCCATFRRKTPKSFVESKDVMATTTGC
jgi:hypothetical protein